MGLVLSQDKLVIFRVTTITVKKLMIPKVKPESKYRHATDAVAKHATGERGSQELRQTEKIETSSKFSWAAHLLFELNAFKHEADTKPWRDIILTWIYITFVFVCVIAVIIAYANRDAIEEWRLQSQDDSDVPSIPIVVATECSSSWGCYDNWGSSHPSFVHVRHAYSTIAAQKKCDHNFNDTIASRNARAQFSSRICYSSVYRDGLDIDIPFDAALTYGANQALSVTITSPSSKLFVSVDVEPSQRKTIFISAFYTHLLSSIISPFSMLAKVNGLRNAGKRVSMKLPDNFSVKNNPRFHPHEPKNYTR